MIARRDDLVVGPAGWARFRGRRMACALGRRGVVADKREGDGATPAGVFQIQHMYWRPDRLRRPVTALAAAPIGPADGWSDDPRDPAYNQPIRLPHGFGCERLRRADRLYDLVVVFDANRAPIQPGRGSALFLHVWRRPRFPTAGCVAFERTDLLWILARWTARSRLVISA